MNIYDIYSVCKEHDGMLTKEEVYILLKNRGFDIKKSVFYGIINELIRKEDLVLVENKIFLSRSNKDDELVSNLQKRITELNLENERLKKEIEELVKENKYLNWFDGLRPSK